ncbi:mucin-17 isoform X2 [Amyelois transitella]|uniref:mucin-17 isoform X2 n=1 Tax=Amyelois transitella TaxID=680683 RepID=UPI00298FDD87|nr:mucin-17 isoform X2 [Amyelois transitella]
MLQPRLSGCEMGGKRNCVKFGVSFVFFALIFASLVSCQELLDDESIEATRIKREGVPENRDLTVLLVNDQKRNDYSKIGRYHSVKPLIGLLTSTARTFIQDGVTTEFATQILGTTLDNGRIYAQLLTKSSLVLYNKPSNVDDPVVVKPTRAHSAFDGQWNVKQDLGFIDPEKFVLKNTDYLAPSSKMDIIYASKPAQDNLKYWNTPTSLDNQAENQIYDEPVGRRVQPINEIPRYVHNEALNFLDSPSIGGEKKLEFVIKPSILENVNTLHRQNKAYEKETEPIKSEPIVNENKLDESNIVKVKPDYVLPTFTIKNEFSPIFYYIDNVESRQSPPQVAQETKLPKRLFGQKSEPRPKKTFTYEGFADFTTVVGDTVIVFTPNTDIIRPQNPEEVNVFPSAKPINKLSNKITFLASDIPVATATFKANEANTATKVPTPTISDISSETPVYNNDELQKAHYDIDNRAPDTIAVQNNNGFDFNLDVIQPSEAGITTTESTRLSGDLEVIPIQDLSSKATDPLSSIQPSATIVDESTESIITESDLRQVLINSEEEADNTAAEVTEKIEEEEEEDEESTTEIPEEIFTTTESGHSEESSEEFETTTETKHDTYDEEELCTNGVETQSTMTTAYKTLTYLTTYFIPLESTETTTSVKSDVVVESDVGYLTNIVCKTNYDIQPTSVISLGGASSIDSNIEIPEIVLKETDGTKNSDESILTEQPPKTTTIVDEKVTTQKDEKVTVETDVDSVESSDESNQKETTTSTTSTTTTERVSTSHSHVEVSVSTEHSNEPTEKPSSEEINETQENEIDLIYKTLYTTYTYFTTFFGEQTSSVASHKSVITNIITSTVDLSQLDPTLLGAFNEDEIAPTSVGIGRPTESYQINSIIDLVKNKDVLESVEVADTYSSQTPTPSLGDDVVASIKPDAVKTYYTTYTFFTTIYVGDDANVCSRSEVYTNYVGPEELIPTKSNTLTAESTKAPFNFANCKQVKKSRPEIPENNSSVETSVSMEEDEEKPFEDKNTEKTPQPTPIEVDMLFSVESNPLETENSYVTDVKSSSSKGETKYLDNNNILEDQISSESNIDEILPSPTLLLQTSYTTFTYFTTMYIGKDSSNIKSRLETITNVVTETIMPKKEQQPEEESNLPITYYTTFTYWTTLYKDKSTTITSREEIVSNVVTPPVQVLPTISPIDTTPIDIDSALPPKDLEVELKPSLVDDNLEQDDGKATFYTTYTYFTTFYSGNTSNIKSSLETVTNIVDNTKVVEDNQLGRKVPSGSVDKNLIQDNGEKPQIIPTVVKEEIKTTALPDVSSAVPTVIVGTYIDNLFAEVKPADSSPTSTAEKKILFSQVAVISGDSTVVTSDNKTLNTETTTSSTTTTGTNTEASIINASPEVIESSVAEPETTTEPKQESEEESGGDGRKKSRLTFTPKKPTFTPVIVPFASRNRPTFSPKRVPLLTSATTITRLDFTPTITATPTLKSVRPTGFGSNRKQSAFPGSSSQGRRFSGRASASGFASNLPSASRASAFPRGSIQPTSRRTGFRSSSLRSNSLDYASRSVAPKIRPTAASRLRNGRQSATISFPSDQNEAETLATQQEENITESLDEVTEAPVRTTNNPLLRFRRPLINRQPGTAITPRSTTPAPRRNAGITSRGRVTTTTRRTTTTRSTPNPILSLRRQRPNALFPRRNLFRQPEPEPEEEIKETEQKVEDNEELLEEEEEFDTDNDYDSSDRKEQQVATPSTPAPKKNVVQIRPFAFRRRTKRQVDYGSRKYATFRRPGSKASSTRKVDIEPETEAPAPATPKTRASSRFSSRVNSNTRSTTVATPKSSSRQPFIIRGESRSTTTVATPAYRRGKSRPTSRTTTYSSRPKAPRLANSRSQSDRPRTTSSRTTNKSRQRTTTSRGTSRQRGSYENTSGERFLHNLALNDGKITITHHIPTEVTIPVVNGKITEYKSVLSATPSVEILLRNQVTASVGPLGNQQLVLAHEATELGENGATKLIRYLIHETPTTTVVFTPTTIRGRRTSYSHILPSTVYNVEAVTQTVAPEINSNVPLANLLLSQLLLGNQQPAINPLLALQGQALLPQQAQTPVTEYKTRTTTYVTTVTDARETVLPITFRGKAILTTIVDPTTSVVTATEFVTDTVVTTPTAIAQAPQINSLLLPLLLQQQQQQQQQQPLALQTANPLLGLAQPDLLQNNLLQNNNLNLNNDIYSNSPKPNILSDFNSNEEVIDDAPIDSEEDSLPPPPPRRATKNRPKAPKPSPPKMTSVVTLYVSGRYPGEFSTVLSTVVTDETQTVRKREAIYYDDVMIQPSILPSVDELVGSQADVGNVLNDSDKYMDKGVESQLETQSLESIVGELSKHIRYDASPTYVVKLASPSSIRTNIQRNSLDEVS